MSNILWGIGQLVNDPSATLISTLQKHIFRKESNSEAITISSTTTRQKHVDKKLINNVASQNLNESSPAPSCSLKTAIELRTKQTQVGTGLKKRHQLSTQCSESLNLRKRSSKATSAARVIHTDRNIGTSNVYLKDARTETEKKNLCEEHQRAMTILKKWPTGKKTRKVSDEFTNKVTLLKFKLLESLKCLKLDKIQSIPQNRCSDVEVMKLYQEC